MNTKLFIGIAPPEKMYNFEHVEVTCPTKKPNSDQLKLLQFFNEEGLKSVTPGGKWLIDTEYNYTTLIFKPAAGETAEDTLAKVKDIIDINFFHTFKITTESVNESVDATTIDSINDYVKNVFMSPAGIKSQPMNIIYDTTVDVETSEMKVCAFTTPDATENDTKYLKDIFKGLEDEFSKRSDIENVKSNYSKENNVYNLEFKFKGIEKPEDAEKSEKEKKAETELPKIEKPKDENSTETKELEPTKFKTERLAKATHVALKKLFENEDEPSTEDLVDNAVSIELWPAVLPDGSLAAVVANSLNVEASDFEEGCKKLREKQLLITDEDDDETLASDFNTDAFVVIRAPESVEEEGLFDWIDTVGQTLEAVGFDVTVNMEEDTDPSEFEQIEEPEAEEFDLKEALEPTSKKT